MKKFLGCSISILLGSFGFAEVKPFMDQMLQDIFALKPYMVSPTAFKDPKNAATIQSALDQMVELSEKIPHEKAVQRSGFLVSAKVLNQQLKESVQVFELGNKDYSLWMLKSTLGVCMSCHTQLPAISTKFSTLNKSHALVDPFEEAEFLFVIRNFKEALPLYTQALEKYPENGVSSENLEKILYRQIFYYVRVDRDFKELSSALQTDLQNKNLPKNLRKRIEAYKAAANQKKNESFPFYSNLQEDELANYSEDILKNELNGHFNYDDPKKELQLLELSSVLYEHLIKYPGSRIKPSILYWLSFCETRYGRQTFFSLPELYLKQCVLDFPKSLVAKKCFKEYQDLVTTAFTGTRGASIPEDVTKELKTMQTLIEQVGSPSTSPAK